MADIKTVSNTDLIKMSQKDRMDLLKKLLYALAQQKLRVRTNEDKQSHKISAYKKQIAQINTINNNQAPSDEK